MPATTTAKNTATKPPHKIPAPVINWPLVCQQIDKGTKTQNQAALDNHVTRQAVYNQFTRWKKLQSTCSLIKDPQALEEFKKNRADILAEKQREIVAAMTTDKIEKASLGTLALAKCQLYDKERLERGLSTGNLSVFGHIIGEANQAIAAGDL